MPLRKINATSATVKPPVGQRVYDTWRLVRFELRVQHDANTSIRAVLQKGKEDENGNWEMSNLPSDKIKLMIDDLDAAMSVNPELETTANTLLQAVENYAIAHAQL